MQPPEGPPVCTAFTGFPLAPPPPMSYTKFLIGVPRGISTSPVFCTFPTSENTFVPALLALPVCVNHEGPLITIGAILHQVSTLLMFVGLPHNPFCAGNGGRGRGLPATPSRDAISAVSSPRTNAPAPSTRSMLNLNPRRRMFSPSSPYSFACSIALDKL